jgi:dienelactone hydrolase
MQVLKPISVIILSTLFFYSCNNQAKTKQTQSKIMEENISYKTDDVSMLGFVAYEDSSRAKRPVVLIIPEWWGLNDYTKSRARQLAALGYLAIAIDMYGDGKQAMNPEEAGKLAMPFYKNAALAKSHFDAALKRIKGYDIADTNRIAAIGYCFGGSMVLNIARFGEDLDGVVSFHGGLKGIPADKNIIKADILVCHGDSDKFVGPEEVAAFKHEMDSVGASYKFVSYANATHAFSNPDATANGKKFSMPIAYNEEADKASWKEMKEFLEKIFRH